MRERFSVCRFLLLAAAAGIAAPALARAADIDLSQATVVVETRSRTGAEATAAAVLVEEIERRTGIRLPVANGRPAVGASIVVAMREAEHPESYTLESPADRQQAVVTIAGASRRGVLYGVGAFLRKMDWGKGRLKLEAGLAVESKPASAIRGHQLGYRATANSWDAWTVEQFDRYIRELALFGVNSIENIPFQDPRNNPLMKVSRREMNRSMSGICRKYGLDYWVWTPADVDLADKAKRDELLKKFDEVFDDSATLTGVFVPGGDPGHNPPELVMPLLEEIARRLKPKHPQAKVWLSLQGFDAQKEEAVYRYIEEKMPEWLGGLVAGPSSPPIARTRARLPGKYGLRLYPDITHNKICQYQVADWDQAYVLTLGREAVNPRAADYARIHNRYAASSDGFITYSDGVHDDVNKVVWSALGWDRSRQPREILIEYARFFFGPEVAEEAADAMLALERNWAGPLMENGSVEATLREWRRLEAEAPQLEGNWRWQMNLLRANYDSYVRRRLIHESGLEGEANAVLAKAGTIGAERAMGEAEAILNRAVTAQAGGELKARIIDLCEKLFQSIGLQTSVEKYHASGAERGAVLDFVDYPLNNRWWLEDEFKKVRALAGEPAKVGRLVELAAWENPGPGSYYDDIGNVSKSPRVEGDAEQKPETFRGPEPTFWWWDNGKSRARLSWQTTMWPQRMVYEGLDPAGKYVVRTSGYGKSLLSIDGVKARATVDGTGMGEYKEFPVAAEHLKDRRLVLTWEIPADEGHLNWRQQSRLAEVWLLKRE